MGPYDVIKGFEQELCRYTGAPFAVAVNSGTAALLLACEHEVKRVGGFVSDTRPVFNLPKRTYVSVPQAVKRAGGEVAWSALDWRGAYRLEPSRILDSACRFTSGMYVAGDIQCVSFAAAKILGAEQGGAILHDDPVADAWYRRMRFDGRTEGLDPAEDTFDLIGHHCMMLPSVAATLLVRLYHLPKHNADIRGASEYPDISEHTAWR